MSGLPAFFAAMAPFLRGEATVADVRAQLGAAAPEDGLRFYGVLMQRNALQAMRELFPALPAAADRHRPGLWAELVHEFLRAHPPAGRHPDRVGDGFPEWLAGRRASHPDEPAILAELADFHAAQLAAATTPDPAPGDDGFDRTIHVRLYTHPVSAIATALLADPGCAELAAPAMTPIVVYRHRVDGRVRLLFPKPAALVALARRAGTPVPEAFDLVPAAAVHAALRRLYAEGVLAAPAVAPPMETTT